MEINAVLALMDSADIFVTVNGRTGFISNACRIGNAWTLFVSDADTRAKIGTVDVPVDGTVGIVRIDR